MIRAIGKVIASCRRTEGSKAACNFHNVIERMQWKRRVEA